MNQFLKNLFVRNFEFKYLELFFLVILAIIAYWGGLSDLVTRWNTQEEYGHGYFIPLIAIWFLWNRKQALIDSIGQPTLLGPFIIMLGALGLILGEITALFLLIQLGFILTLIGSVMAFGGYSLLRVTILPILFLMFAIPLPYFIDAQLSWRLQILSSELGVSILRLFGISVYLEGNVIDLGVYKLQVVEACSGLRYLYPLLSIGFLMAYMYKGNLWQRSIIFISTIPITVVMNSIRIAVVGMLVNKWGLEQAEGFAHYFEGWIIFMVCLGILVVEILVFEFLGKKRSFNTAVDLPEISVKKANVNLASRLPRYLSVFILGLSIAIVNMVSTREDTVPKRNELIAFPLEIEGWKGKLASLDQDVIDQLKLDDYLLADYTNPNIGTVNFYVAYYKSQRKGASPHSPSVCIPGGGWVISSLDVVSLNNLGGEAFDVNRVIISKDNHKQIVYYWFEQRGRHITNQYLMKLYLLKDAIQRNRTDGALVRVTAMIRPGENEQQVEEKIQSYIKNIMPKLTEYVPE